MTPPKPSAQTQLLLSHMEEMGRKEDECWDQVMENLDLLFAKVGEIDANQQKMNTWFDMSTKVME